MKKEQPEWQPISELPIFIDRLQAVENETIWQCGHLRSAVEMNYFASFDANTLERINKVYREQLDDLWLIEEQLARRKREPLSAAEAERVGDAISHFNSLKWTSEEILRYVEQVATKSVIAALEMDEGELALTFLTGEINLPK